MTNLWQKMDLSGETPQAVGDAGALPGNLLGLDRATLADLSALAGSGGEANVGYWPVTEIRPATGVGKRLASTFIRTVDADAKSVAVTYQIEPLALADRKAAMRAATRSRYAQEADGGTTATLAPGVTVAVATTTAPVTRLTRALEYMTAESLSSMKVVTTAGVPVDLTPAVAGAMLAAVDAHVASCEETQNLLVAAIQAAANHAALDLIDIEAGSIDDVGGWP